MRFRPGPLIETTSLFAIAFVLAFGSFAVIWGDAMLGFNSAYQSVLLLFMPLFSLNAIAAFVLRDRSSVVKFVGQVAGILVVAVAGWALLNYNAESPTQIEAHIITLTVIVFAATGLVGSAVTQFVLIDNEGPRLKIWPFKATNAKTRVGQPEPLNTFTAGSKKKKKK